MAPGDHTEIESELQKGLGISLLPEMFLKSLDSNVRKVPVTPCAIRTLGIGILSEKTLSTCSKAFIKLAQKMTPELNNSESN